MECASSIKLLIFVLVGYQAKIEIEIYTVLQGVPSGKEFHFKLVQRMLDRDAIRLPTAIVLPQREGF